jgi:hypothetical protein
VSEDVRNINKVAPVTKSAPGAAGAVRKDKAWVLKGKPVEVSFFRISDCHQDKDALHSLDLIISLLRIFFFAFGRSNGTGIGGRQRLKWSSMLQTLISLTRSVIPIDFLPRFAR